ncbi:MAG: hypothetical protein ABFS19_13330 [Thermodesulfobacteriota bacterium]
MTRQEPSDKRLGLLALSTQDDPPKGVCPDGETLAALVEGSIVGEKRAELLEHVSACESCYRQWLELHQLLNSEKKPARILRFPRRNLTRIGSALAAAASIALFLNIVMSPEPGQPPQLPQKPDREQVKKEKSRVRSKEAVVVPLEEARVEDKLKKAAPPRPAVMSPESKRDTSEDEVDGGPRPAESVLQEAAPARQLGMARKQSKGVEPPRQWLGLLGRGCTEQVAPPVFWQSQLTKGVRDYPALLERYPELSRHLQGLASTENGEEICRKLLEMLAIIESEMVNIPPDRE